MAFKDRLKELRKKSGLTQEELANKLNIPESSIRRYESSLTGYPNPKRVMEIANFFSVSTDYLYEKDKIIKYSNDELDSYKEKLIREVQHLNEDDAENIYKIVKKIKK